MDIEGGGWLDRLGGRGSGREKRGALRAWAGGGREGSPPAASRTLVSLFGSVRECDPVWIAPGLGKDSSASIRFFNNFIEDSFIYHAVHAF